MCPNTMQPSCRDKKSGWRLAGSASDFVVRDLCCIWITQDMAEAPLVKSINSSTESGRHTNDAHHISPFSQPADKYNGSNILDLRSGSTLREISPTTQTKLVNYHYFVQILFDMTYH